MIAYRTLKTCCFTVAALCAGTVGAADAEKPAPEAVSSDKSAEATIRSRFLVTYQTAKTPAAKAQSVSALKGLTEKESRRLLAGMLGDHDEAVRIAACQAMSATPDPDGYFVKPLMGALTDTSDFVRMGAADALGSARIRADAIKALTFALLTAVGKISDGDDDKRVAQVVESYNSALERLTAQHSKNKDPRSVSAFWVDYWKQNEDALRAKDLEVRGGEPEPVRPNGLEPDSFDKPEKVPEKKK
jgi:HEAT repeat protein